MLIKKLPDIDFYSFVMEELDNAVDFSHALIELKIQYDFHHFNDSYHFIVDTDAFESIMKASIDGALQELMPDEEKTND